ncbi:MAG: hypothetical protein AAAFM81_11005 [Pseudomonadota bacterium]
MKHVHWSVLTVTTLFLTACGEKSAPAVDTEPGMPSVVEMLELGCGGDSVCLDAVKTHYDDCVDAVSAEDGAPTDVASLTTAVSICIGERVTPDGQ